MTPAAVASYVPKAITTFFHTQCSSTWANDPLTAFHGVPPAERSCSSPSLCPVGSTFKLERSMASATFVTFFAVTYTAMITRMINGELNYRIPASHSHLVPKSTIRRHVFLFSLCHRMPSFQLLQVPFSHEPLPLMLISLSQRTNLPLSCQNFFCLQDRASTCQESYTRSASFARTSIQTSGLRPQHDSDETTY